MPKTSMSSTRHLVIVLGDQLNLDSAAFDRFDPVRDRVWMAEVAAESTHVWSHKCRIAFFLSAMRHFRQRVEEKGYSIDYRTLDDPTNRGTLAAELTASIERWRPEKLIVVEPGEFRVQKELEEAARDARVPLEIREDRHFICSREEFAKYARGKRQLRMEFFYRTMRKKTGILMHDGEPLGGRWNFDAENRGSFGKAGPKSLPAPRRFQPNEITREVFALVEKRFAKHPGSLKNFDWPLTPTEAELALTDFLDHRLPVFGQFQDAMWADEPWLFHSRLSAAMNVKLIDPRKVIMAAERCLQNGVPLASVEGFIRQILGWREYVRGVYWHFMPKYAEKNELNANQPLPQFYWTGKTDMNCLRQTIEQTLEFGYAHHIQRLMVTGLFALLLGVRPEEVHKWYLAVYVDAVEWVELPNTLGMSQYADGGIMASKPYVATGKYLQRMSNYCTSCPYDPNQRTGDQACPFTTLYWDFLMRHEEKLAQNTRTVLQVRNVQRISKCERQAIQQSARTVRERYQ